MRALPGRASRTSTTEAPVTREDLRADQRRRILRAVGELVAKRGYADVTVELIVKRAHVSYTTFYKHFASKEEAFVGLFDTAFARVERRIRDKLAEVERPWPEQVVTALETYVDLIAADPLLARACLVEGPTAGPALFERYIAATKSMAPLLRAGRQYSPRAAELPETMEETLAGAIVWSAYQRLIVGRADLLPGLLPEMIELVLRPYVGDQEAASLARETAPFEK